jgi:hypothetical protein
MFKSTGGTRNYGTRHFYCNKFINVGIQYYNSAKMDSSKEKNEVQVDEHTMVDNESPLDENILNMLIRL